MKTSSLSAVALLLVSVMCAQACATATELPETTPKKDSGLGVDAGTGLDETGDDTGTGLDGGSTVDSTGTVDFGSATDTGATGSDTGTTLSCANTCSVNADCSVCTDYVGSTACCQTGTGMCYYVSGNSCPGSTTTTDSGTGGS